MYRRILAVIISAMFIVGLSPAMKAGADTAYIVNHCPPPQLAFDPIQSGLWAGVNLDATGLYTSTGTKVFVTPNGTICSTPTDVAQAVGSDFTSQVTAANNAQTVTAPPSGSAAQSTAPMDNSGPTPTAVPPAPASTAGAYVAMGDSVAAGAGLPNPVQDSAGQSNCGRTTGAYPFLVATAQNMPVMNIACSGASAMSMNTSSTGPFGSPSQLRLAFASGTPKLLTLTIGANDVRWTQLVSDCFFGNCATMSETNQADADLATLQKNLVGVMNSVQTLSKGSPPDMIVTGYYNPIASCNGASQNITAAEITWMNAEVYALNATIQGVVATYPFAHFTAVDFTGHDICSSDSWVQSLASPQPFHPTATGQQAIAQDVNSTLSNFPVSR